MDILKILGVVVTLFAASSAANADGFDGSQPLICASMEAYDCAPGEDCIKGTAESIDAPQFMRLDFEHKVARATRANGEERTAKIESMTQEEGKLILQGVQLGLGWSMTIAQENGAMTLTAAGDRMAFVVFGACTPL
jgi:hypothetical protein